MLQVSVELTQCREVRLLERIDVALEELLVDRSIFGPHSGLDCPLFALEDYDLLDREEGVSEGDDTDEKHYQESHHVPEASEDHSNEPREGGNRLQVEEEAQPNHQGRPSLHLPEARKQLVVFDHIVQDQRQTHQVAQLFRRKQVIKFADRYGAGLNNELVDGSDDEKNSADVILHCKAFIVCVNVDNHDVRPVPENEELKHCRKANREDVNSLPVIKLTVDEDLD